jgi:CubicO group peptidase (beta-lactamase class C family)
VRRGDIRTTHPYWNLVLEPGRVWDEPGDHGFSRAALPFALLQKDMNCTHNGVLSFVFRSDGQISRVAVQVSSETCNYLQMDMWGLLQATYAPEAAPAREAVIAASRKHLAARLPVRAIAQLAVDHPGFDLAALKLGDPRARTVYGFVADGIHYVSGCPTRHGEYPFCEVLDIPSYSVAKTLVAALASMRMEQVYPGTMQQKVASHVAACSGAEWAEVRFGNLLDMSSGHDDSARYMADEDAVKVQDFFYERGAAGKAHFSCAAYPRKTDPGIRWVYRTSDTYLLGMALNDFLRAQPGRAGQDIFRDVLVKDIYAPLALSATAQSSLRTDDATAQPLFGYGLTLHRDDFARLASFIGTQHGEIDGRQLLDPEMLHAAMQQDPQARGLAVASLPEFRYQHGFWARNVQPLLGCAHPTWVPFMSGYGGLSVVLFPNGSIYYNVADDGKVASFDWGKVTAEARKLGDFCQ